MKLEIDTSKLLSKVDSHVTRVLLVLFGSLGVGLGIAIITAIGLRFLAALCSQADEGGNIFVIAIIMGIVAIITAACIWGKQYLDD